MLIIKLGVILDTYFKRDFIDKPQSILMMNRVVENNLRFLFGSQKIMKGKFYQSPSLKLMKSFKYSDYSSVYNDSH